MNATFLPATDAEVVKAMMDLGNDFVRKLAWLCNAADADNLHIIKTSFAHYWVAYSEKAVESREGK